MEGGDCAVDVEGHRSVGEGEAEAGANATAKRQAQGRTRGVSHMRVLGRFE